MCARTAGLIARFPPFPVRRLEFVQGAAQRFKLVLVGKLLALGHLDQFEHFLHLFQRLFQ